MSGRHAFEDLIRRVEDFGLDSSRKLPGFIQGNNKYYTNIWVIWVCSTVVRDNVNKILDGPPSATLAASARTENIAFLSTELRRYNRNPFARSVRTCTQTTLTFKVNTRKTERERGGGRKKRCSHVYIFYVDAARFTLREEDFHDAHAGKLNCIVLLWRGSASMLLKFQEVIFIELM